MDFKNNIVSAANVGIITDTDNESGHIKQIAYGVISPALISFVWWVLTNARKNGYKRLYFLARDGYIMYKIAAQFCTKFNLGIECRYLYGSRLAWRTAVYHLIGDEKYKHIFSGGYLITPRIILKRVQASREQRHKIYNDINNIDSVTKDGHTYSNKYNTYNLLNENQALNAENIKIFSEQLKKSAVFNEYLDYISKKQFENVSMYLYQEGVFEGDEIVLVDSGWTGSIQRTLRQIAEQRMNSPKITGYYFGLYNQSDDIRDGKYEAWYFTPKSPVNIMTNFNNNVFECMCASPFNMTVGYEFSENSGVYNPVFNNNYSDENNANNTAYNSNYTGNAVNMANIDNIERAKLFNYYIEQFTADFFNNSSISFDSYNNTYLENTRKILQRFMMNPTKTEAEVFGKFKFCDDASDCYENEVACFIDKSRLKSYFIINRFLHKMRGKKTDRESIPDLFWFHGSLAVSGIKKQNRYRLNYKLWETIRLLTKKYKSIRPIKSIRSIFHF